MATKYNVGDRVIHRGVKESIFYGTKGTVVEEQNQYGCILIRVDAYDDNYAFNVSDLRKLKKKLRDKLTCKRCVLILDTDLSGARNILKMVLKKFG